MGLSSLVLMAALAQPARPAVPIDPCESVVIAQVRHAISELKSRALGDAVITIEYEGLAHIEAHLMRPGMLRDVPVRLELIDDPTAHGFVMKETSGTAPNARTETTIVLDGRVAEQTAPDFKEATGDAALIAGADAAAWTPWTLARAALSNAASCRPGADVGKSESTSGPISYVDGAHRACTLLLDGDRRIARAERLVADQRLGDVCNWVQFDDWEQRDGVEVPQKVTRFIVQGAATIRYELSLKRFAIGAVSRDVFTLPESHRRDIPSWGTAPAASEGFTFVPIAEHVWSVEIAAANSRVLVIERDHDLVTLGAPDGDSVCSSLVAALKERFPGKSIGIAAFGHHHPSPSGGLRAIAATGTTLVVPRGLEDYTRSLLARRVDLGPPAVAGPAEPRLEIFDGSHTIDCGTEQVRLLDIADQSAHAFHYVVFFLPAAGLLFEDDLGYFPTNGGARAGPRLVGLADALEGQHITPRRLIQAWPIRDVVREVEWSSVGALVKSAKEAAQNK